MRVLITGGTGTIGKALVATRPTHQYAVYSRDEHKQAPLRGHVECFVGDVADKAAMRRAVARYDPGVVIHAAAIKHVSTAELDPLAAIRSNVDGTASVLEAAHGRTVVVISTDKAVEPTTAYGASKMLAERLAFDAFSHGTRGFVVRYGNVFGSTGSYSRFLLEEWVKAKREACERHDETGECPVIQPGHHFRLTAPKATRFWWSPCQAASWVWDCLEHYWLETSGRKRPRLYVPLLMSTNMAQLVHNLFPQSTTETTGLTAGEKEHETMAVHQDDLEQIPHGLGGRPTAVSRGDGLDNPLGRYTSNLAMGMWLSDVLALANRSAVELGL